MTVSDVKSSDQPDASTTQYAGLCASCRHVQVVPSARGSVFFLCRKSAEDPAFRKYPTLPVLQCRGYARRPEE